LDGKLTLIGASLGDVIEIARSYSAKLIMRGVIMINEYSTRKNKHSKVHFQQYLYNSGEPRDIISRDTPADLEDELLEDSHIMRRQFRLMAQRMRNQYQ
jgi:hypothetical protein